MALIYDQAATAIRWIYDNRISGPAVLDSAAVFPEGAHFVDAWESLRAESLTIAESLHRVPRFHEIMPEQAAISANDRRDWRMFIAKAYGVEAPQRLAQCPVLAGLVARAPSVLSASYSFLAPGKVIPPHRGPFRGVLRFYLVLTMPRLADGRPAAVLEIDDQEYRLGEGDSLLWDDTYRHAAWNASSDLRIVLLLDVWRPDMPADMALFSAMLIGLVRLGIRWRGTH